VLVFQLFLYRILYKFSFAAYFEQLFYWGQYWALIIMVIA